MKRILLVLSIALISCQSQSNEDKAKELIATYISSAIPTPDNKYQPGDYDSLKAAKVAYEFTLEYKFMDSEVSNRLDSLKQNYNENIGGYMMHHRFKYINPDNGQLDSESLVFYFNDDVTAITGILDSVNTGAYIQFATPWQPL